MAFYRHLSPVERTSYLAFEEPNCSPRVNQFVIEGKGDLEVAELKKAVEQTARVHPGCRLQLKGKSKLSYWDDAGPLPLVSEVDASSWDGRTTVQTEFFYAPMSYRDGPTVELVILRGETARLLVRTHHAVMDGGGTMIFLRDLFRALRGEALQGSNSNVADFDVFKMNDFGGGNYQMEPMNAIPALGTPEANGKGFNWRRAVAQGSPPRALQKVALAIAREAHSHGAGKVRLRIPVDLRRHLDDSTVTLANCTGAIDLEVAEEDTDKTLFRQMAQKLKSNQDLVMSRKLGMASWAPIGMFGISDAVIQNSYRRGTFQRTGTISHMGKFNGQEYSFPGFDAHIAYGTPPRFDLQSIYVGLWDSSYGTQVLLGSPEAFSSGGRLDAFMQKLPEVFQCDFEF